MGRVSFCALQDRDGRIQLYARQDEMDEAVYKKFKKFDIGDIVGVEGEVFRTQRGEMSVRAKNITLLSKALLPLPEKFHGLTDLELRYRQRYVDLIVNPEVKRNFVIRSKFIKHVRDFLDERGYMEVETPVLNTISGGATARPFITHHNTLDIDMYMRIATELPLKRLIVGGLDRVYEIGRIFRNEGMDPKHNPEFTTVELYQAYTDFNGMMDLFEDLLSSAAQKILGTYQVTWMGHQVDLTPSWKRVTMADAVKKAGSKRRREQNRARLQEGEMNQIKVPYSAGRGALGMASAEQRLLAAMLREPGYIDKASAQLRPEQFLQPQQKELYEAMLRCREQGVEVSLATLRAFVSEEALNELSRLAAQYSDVNCTPEDIKLYLERIARGTPVASRAASMSTNDIEQYLQSMREQKQGTADAEDSV